MNLVRRGQHTLPPELTVQRHLTRVVPGAAPAGRYECRARIGVPPTRLYDDDAFELDVVSP